MLKPSPRFQEYIFVRKKILGLKILKVALKSVSFLPVETPEGC